MDIIPSSQPISHKFIVIVCYRVFLSPPKGPVSQLKLIYLILDKAGLTFGTGVLHLIQINHQPDATIFQFIILTFVYRSTCFGRFPAHHQELNDCNDSGFTFVSWRQSCCVRGRAGRPDREHSTAVTTIRRQNQRLPLQSLSS